jgi:hypothetical protein
VCKVEGRHNVERARARRMQQRGGGLRHDVDMFALATAMQRALVMATAGQLSFRERATEVC